MSKKISNRFFLSVIGRDRPGIIASVTCELSRLGCNLEDVSMTRLDGQFAMMMAFQPGAHAQELKLRKTLERLEKQGGLNLWLRGFRIPAKPGKKTSVKSLIITAIGPDQVGIVYHLSRFMAVRGLNITDLNTRMIPAAKKPLYSLLLEIEVPPHFSPKKLEPALRSLGRRLAVDIHIRAVEPLAL